MKKDLSLIGNGFNILTRMEQKQIIGGLGAPPFTKCSVFCANGDEKKKDCGDGVSCTTNKTTITCGNGSVLTCVPMTRLNNSIVIKAG